jgi:uncharacterized protein YktA (UPF0223 family)
MEAFKKYVLEFTEEELLEFFEEIDTFIENPKDTATFKGVLHRLREMVHGKENARS